MNHNNKVVSGSLAAMNDGLIWQTSSLSSDNDYFFLEDFKNHFLLFLLVEVFF